MYRQKLALIVSLLAIAIAPQLSAQTGLITTVAGGGSGGPGGLAINAQISGGGICVDPSDNIYFADRGNNAVGRIDAVSGILTVVAGTGVAASTGDFGPASQASLNAPTAVALDHSGNLYIAEYVGQRIRRIDAQTGIITTVAGTGIAGYNGDGGPATGASLFYPFGIAVDSNGNMYIADAGNARVRRVDAQTGIITTVAGNGVRAVTPDGVAAINASLSPPFGVSLDRSGNLLIPEYGSASVRRVNAVTGILSTVAGNGNTSFTGDGVPAMNAGIGRVAGDVATDAAGNIFFADGSGRIRRVAAATGVITTVAGNGTGAQGQSAAGGGGTGGSSCYNEPLGDNGPATSATLDGPFSVALTANGNLLFSDPMDCRIRRVFLPSPHPYTNTVLTLSAPSVSEGRAVTFTATVTPIGAGGTPTGTVQFVNQPLYLGTTVIGSAPLINGTATLTVNTPQSVANYLILAIYQGDGSYNGSGSPGMPLAVTYSANQPVSVSLTPSQNPAALNAPVNFTVTVTPQGGSSMPTGSVSLLDGANQLVTTALLNGTAQFTATFTAIGPHPLVARYSGDSTYAATSSPVVNESVKATGSVTLTSNPNPSNAGAYVVFTAAVSPSTATGSVQLLDGATVLGTQPLSGGVANFMASALTPGQHSMQAVYSGDPGVSAASSAILTQTVNAATTTTLTSSNLSSTYSQTVILTATVSPASATGTVQFMDGSVSLGSAPLIAGAASLPVSTLTAGGHPLTAIYSGDSTNAGSTSAPIAQNVAQAIPVITVSCAANPATVGQFVLFNISFTPASSAVTLSIMDGNMLLATVSPNSSGAASYSTTSLPAGNHPITLVWAGDANIAAGSSAILVETVQSSTTLSVTGPTSLTYGQPASFTATISPSAATGTIQFNDGGDLLGQPAILAGQASVTVPSLTAGTHRVVATYTGDGVYIPNNASITVEVAKVATSAALAVSTNPSTVGQAVSLTASVSPSSAPGQVEFYDGTTLVGVATLTGGTAKVEKAFLTAGTHSLTAVYTGGANFTAATSPAVPQTVKAATTTSLTGPPSLPYGQDIRLVASVTPATATGTVQFLEGATVFGSAAIVSGTATLGLASLPVGMHTITAIYGGDDSDAPSTSGALILTVSKGNTTVALNSSSNPSVFGGPVTFTAIVSPASATGTVQFLDGATPLGAVNVSSGIASITIAALLAGTHSVSAAYTGDANYLGANSAVVAQTVNKANSAVTIASSTNPATLGQPVTFTAFVSPANATGAVQFLDGATVIGTATITGGSASFTTSSLAAGSHSMSASYSGDTNFTASASTALVETVKTSTTVTLSSNGTPSTYGHQVQFTASVSPTTATGTIRFMDGATSLGTVAISSGKAVFSTSSLSGGTHSITAVYSGDSRYLSSTSTAFTQTVNKATSTVTLKSSANNTPLGQPVTFTATLSPLTATGTVQFLDGSTVLSTVPVNAGAATLTISTLAAGPHKISAVYSGDGNYNSDVSGTVTENIK